MVKISVMYQGDKHCDIAHEPSGSHIETDAPKDNAGKGERFSPTDLVGAALGSCILTTMAIVAERADNEVVAQSLKGATAEVTKEMTTTGPRKIARLATRIVLPSGLPGDWRKRLEAAAHACPVHRSLASDLDAPIEFIYQD